MINLKIPQGKTAFLLEYTPAGENKKGIGFTFLSFLSADIISQQDVYAFGHSVAKRLVELHPRHLSDLFMADSPDNSSMQMLSDIVKSVLESQSAISPDACKVDFLDQLDTSKITWTMSESVTPDNDTADIAQVELPKWLQ